MSDQLAELIEFARSHRAGMGYQPHGDALEALVRSFRCDATSRLFGFRVGTESVNEGILIPTDDERGFPLASEANECWDFIRGPHDADRALRLVATARAEYTRCTLADLLMRYREACIENDEAEAEWLLAKIESVDWLQADHVAMLPSQLLFGRERMQLDGNTSARVFKTWIEDSREIDKPVCENDWELYEALAIVFIDAAAANTPAALELLAHAAGARYYGAWDRSQASYNKSSTKKVGVATRTDNDVHRFSQLGLNQRHKKNRDMKARAIEMYKSGKYPGSKESAAEAIAGELGFEQPTVRKWLRNA
ncbi:hypothetical protein C7S18_04210 [Ahniella affigens]|uniref:Uncharacterized protein n=1 Tax=Ahniella affigens TaxID=2021234 RepID=A0A2P1PNP6_9GAMM|nr:hypothetical protein [Ahniella affigens]AVP96447.1 hypothetical protein C7S18_04210 [Ahniella affigens]